MRPGLCEGLRGRGLSRDPAWRKRWGRRWGKRWGKRWRKRWRKRWGKRRGKRWGKRWGHGKLRDGLVGWLSWLACGHGKQQLGGKRRSHG